jgi:NhaA family Na+:H+ antiporter
VRKEGFDREAFTDMTDSGGPDHPSVSSGASIRYPWSRTERRVPRRVIRPLQAFLETEQAGGILLLLAAAAALIWANSAWSASYERLWQTELTIRAGSWSISDDLRHWVNDALMTLFFFVVGLEIKRELVTGELRERRAAALPAVAALGGMVVPALVYLTFNLGGEGESGWGIPMATDIAFALGVLAIVGRGLPPSLKAFLLTLAIVDDIGAIIVIAVFYSTGISLPALGVAIGLLLLMKGFQRLQIRWTVVYVFLGMSVWLATFQSGVHATIAGVALGLLTPAVPFQRPRAVSDEARRVADETVDDPFPPDADAHHWLHISGLSREAVSPLARAQHLLHPWTSYLVVPVFALANAGVALSGSALRDATMSGVTVGVVAGLVVGKVLGIGLASMVVIRTGVARVPEGVTWGHLLGVAALAGIGFTVSLFITGLAFDDPALQGSAKVGILAASILAGLLGSMLLLRSKRRSSEP